MHASFSFVIVFHALLKKNSSEHDIGQQLIMNSVCVVIFKTAKFVDEKRQELIQRVTEVMAITDELGGMIHGEAYSVIEAQDTNQDKMRTLYQRTFRSGGVVVKAAFYDALKKHQPILVNDLGRI